MCRGYYTCRYKIVIVFKLSTKLDDGSKFLFFNFSLFTYVHNVVFHQIDFRRLLNTGY